MCMKIEYIHSSLDVLSNHLTYVASNNLLHMELTINTKTGEGSHLDRNFKIFVFEYEWLYFSSC